MTNTSKSMLKRHAVQKGAEHIHTDKKETLVNALAKIEEQAQRIKELEKDAEKYKQLKEIMCPHEGLSMTLDFRSKDKKYSNRKIFSLTEIQANPFLIKNIQANAGYLWEQIVKAISKGE